MRSFLVIVATARTASLLTAQAGSFTVYGSGCPGSVGTGCISANWTQPFNGNTGAAANFALPFNTGSTVRVICGVELICKTRNSNPVNMNVWIYDTAPTGAPGKILRSTIMPVDGTVKAHRANLSPPLVLTANTGFFIVFDNRVGLNLPIMKSGTSNIHWYNGPPSWRGPFTSQAWNYNVICCGSGAIPKISNTGVPTVGKPFSVDLSMARASSKTLFAIGIKKTSTNLAFIGAPGCTLLTDPIFVLGLTTTATGTSTVQQTVPNDVNLIGVTFYTQFAVADVVNAAQVVFSAGGEGKVGR
ncbi:MAG: hypothetical protein ACYTF5_08730 [Planctomycetota bacterium]|jgi:hypothetical protein